VVVEGVEGSVEVPGEVTLDAPSDLGTGTSFGETLGEICLRGRVATHPCDRDDMERLVQAPVSAAVEAVPRGVAARRRDRVHASERGEGGVVSDSAGVGPSGEDDRGSVCTDPNLVEEWCGGACGDELAEPVLVRGHRVVQFQDATGESDGLVSGGGDSEWFGPVMPS
jgi:hypothetical protein